QNEAGEHPHRKNTTDDDKQTPGHVLEMAIPAIRFRVMHFLDCGPGRIVALEPSKPGADSLEPEWSRWTLARSSREMRSAVAGTHLVPLLVMSGARGMARWTHEQSRSGQRAQLPRWRQAGNYNGPPVTRRCADALAEERCSETIERCHAVSSGVPSRMSS